MLNIKEIRKTKGMSISALARALEVAESTVTRWEAGKTNPRMDQYQKLQQIFGSDIQLKSS